MPSCARRAARSARREQARPEALGVDRVRQRLHLAVRQSIVRQQPAGGVVRRGDDEVGRAVQFALDATGRAEERAVRVEEAMVEHLRREAALIVEEQRNAEHAGSGASDQRALVQMRVITCGRVVSAVRSVWSDSIASK